MLYLDKVLKFNLGNLIEKIMFISLAGVAAFSFRRGLINQDQYLHDRILLHIRIGDIEQSFDNHLFR